MWTIPTGLFAPEKKMLLVDRVIAVAKSIVGQKEIAGNAGFQDPGFQKRMQEVGWVKFQAWCAYTGELIWKEGFGKDHKLYADLDKLFSASAVRTFKNFENSPHFKTGVSPAPGALAIWQHGSGQEGHLGVVVKSGYTTAFNTVEGNTNAAGGREGIEVAEKLRQTGLPFSIKALNLLGFVYLPE